ncbi:hypothetical protein C8A05DRAFT_18505, partial [Staphylotrichum tortipilum]
SDHLSTLTSMANLWLTYGNQGRWEEAEKLDVQVEEQAPARGLPCPAAGGSPC